MSRVALALYVKNEYSDIAGWLAWHFSLGVDTIFVFDDHSIDGTVNILNAASKKFDVRLYSTHPEKIVDHDKRHGECLKLASDMAKEEGFDWIGFLDGDEYLYLSTVDNVKDFLDRFENFDGVAINWCIYGSSGRVVRPRLPIMKTFTARSQENFGDNVLVKSFIRPECFGNNYKNPHRFYDIPADRYADTFGNPVQWIDATNPNVSWDQARVMHFVCRSMEHFVTRIKRRLNIDLRDSSSYWDHFNRNDISDNSYEKFYGKCEKIFMQIQKSALKEAANILSQQKEEEKEKILTSYDIKAVRKIKTSRGSNLALRKSDGKLVHFSTDHFDESNYCQVYGFFYDNYEEYIHLFAVENNKIFDGFFFVKDDLRVSPLLTYKAEYYEDNLFSLRSISQNVFLSAPGHDVAPEQELECNRREALEWEHFVFDDMYEKEILSNAFEKLIVHNNFNIYDLLHMSKKNIYTKKHMWLLPFISMLSNNEKEDLKYIVKGLLDIYI
ncbi:hypothetical protein AA0313_1942 [Acetobacter indonesiensis NRIC 0313]|uniref:Uncharacterized protein n=1 Tax=Acetobacter indonesiensis TaxID=104101 RepID=A0A6N3T6I2_9PROT|nr:glycosyltransferase family 2 protein [Acetobacter indonesiensis]GAN63663.1 hypothetical protein Abin_037_003 [Acetobacter indonesiensis]GBQ58957.1 hypothetical protein AA0313_1942 [Acetobacter indonesiensis NRIC 0313]GEN04886.1 hypothetical protein AIN02nite_29110 [Acetobacter indonesiensis]